MIAEGEPTDMQSFIIPNGNNKICWPPGMRPRAAVHPQQCILTSIGMGWKSIYASTYDARDTNKQYKTNEQNDGNDDWRPDVN